MNVDFMRKVDYYIGVPVCFFLSLLYKFLKLLDLKKIDNNFSPNKILFIELSEMGSTVLAYSAMKKAKELYNAEIFFLIFKENEQSIKLLNLIPDKNIITIRSNSLTTLAIDTIKSLSRIKKLRIDTVVDLELFSRFTSILSYMSGAQARVGFYRYYMEGLYRGNYLTHKVAYNPHIHISQSFMSLVYSLNHDVREIPLLKQHIPFFEIKRAVVKSDESKKKKMYNKLKKYYPNINSKTRIIIINPNASQLLPIRKWPLINFMKLSKKILGMKNTVIAVTGIESEGEDAKAICDFVKNERCIDFTGKTTLSELIDLFNISDIIVSNDSGPSHFASLTDINIIVLFGPETPKIYAPLSKNAYPMYSNFACSPCVSAFNHRKTPCDNSMCLKAIKVENVLSIVKQVL